MDWLEQWFGWNPDGGDGSVEAAIISFALLSIAVVLVCSSTDLPARMLRALRSLVRFRRSDRRGD
jgi:hypothetical protein